MPSRLSIVVPVFNEAATIAEILARVYEANYIGWNREVIVVNDGSTDKTVTQLEELKNKYDFELINLKTNLGKGGAIKNAMAVTTGDYIIIQDADLEYNPADYAKLLSQANDGRVVYGSRNLEPKTRGYFVYTLGGRFLTWLINKIWRVKLTDINTGYKLMPTDLLKSLDLQAARFDFCEEVTIKLLRRGITIMEVPISYEPRSFKQGKKIRWYDGLRAVLTIVKLSYL